MNEHDIVDVNGFDAVVIGGIPRILNKLPPVTAKRAAFPPFGVALAPSVDPAQWVEIDRRRQFTAEWLIDQKSHGSCVGFGTAGALMRAIAMSGGKMVRLSGAYIYSWINGGRDQGAMISDGLKAAMEHGACLETTVGYDSIYRSQTKKGDAEAARYKIFEAYHADNFQELMSGIQMGWIGVGAVQVGNNYSRLDSDGVAGFDAGPGNHCIHFDGVHKLPSGEWVLDSPGSWGTAFGDNGRAYFRKRHIDSVQQDCFVIRAAAQDPLDPNNPPPVKP